MGNINISELKLGELTEQHGITDSDVRVGEVFKYSRDFALMREIGNDPIIDGYFFWNYQMDQSTFFQNTGFLKGFQQLFELAKNSGLKDVSNIQEIENLQFKHPLDEMIKYLADSKSYADFYVFNNATKETVTYDGYIVGVDESTINIFSPDDYSEDDLTIGEKLKINKDEIYAFDFNTWEYRFATQIINEKLKQKWMGKL